MGGPAFMVWVVTQQVCVDFFFLSGEEVSTCTRRGSRLPPLDEICEKQMGVLHCHLSILRASTLLYVALARRRNGEVEIHKDEFRI